MPNFIRIRPVVADLFRADERTDMRKLIVASHNFANATKTGMFTSKKHSEIVAR
jgi:hypothetical protein